MTRREENEMVIAEIARSNKNNPIGTYEEVTTFQFGTIASMLVDISKSLAILADKAGSEGEE